MPASGPWAVSNALVENCAGAIACVVVPPPSPDGFALLLEPPKKVYAPLVARGALVGPVWGEGWAGGLSPVSFVQCCAHLDGFHALASRRAAWAPRERRGGGVSGPLGRPQPSGGGAHD